MNLIETDVLYALFDLSDVQHKVALRLFERVREGGLKASLSSLSLLELELLIRSGDILNQRQEGHGRRGQGMV